MTDSEDDDWFDKDIDDFVLDIQGNKGNESILIGTENNLADNFLGGPSQFFDSDYGGNYNKAQQSNNSAKQNTNKSNDVETKFIQAISYKKLSFILEQDALQIFLEVIPTDSGFIETINKATISYEVIALTLKTIANILSLPLNEHIKCFLKNIFDAKNYWKQIENYMKELTTNQKCVRDKKKIIIAPSSETEFWEHLCVLCRHMVKYQKMDETFFERAIKLIVDSKHEKKLTKFKNDLEVIRGISSKQESSRHIFPTLDELLAKGPDYVQPNIIKGRYSSVSHYLDVHLSLLREDFISPLRDGIAQFQQDLAETGTRKSNGNIKLYPTVRILTKQKTNSRSHKGEYLMVDLEPDTRQSKELRSVYGENTNLFSKRLMFGSLLLLTTSDSFVDLILAVVSNRDTDLLSQGYIQIEILKTSNISILFEKDFIMMESEIYFEPYNQVYRVLNNFTEESFPMSNYIIDIDPNHQFPNYVPTTPKVVYTHKKYALDLKDTSKWPAAHMLKLNENQLTAFKTALTTQFSIVQGPPGTGKTLIGLEILKALLKNTDEQILIICCTNHALDQFLTGVLNFTEDIVRMGNQSKNELLDRFNIKQLTENYVTDKRIKNCFYKAKCEYTELMQKFEELQNKMESNDDRKTTEKKILDIQERLRSISRKQEEIKQISEYNVLKSTRVIGMTTTCSARCNTLLHLLKTPIVFVEEAAELLESHIIAALSNETQNLILIGDHQQLRPTTSVYKLAKFYNMDVSLFERMINNGINCTQLNVQHRMRPEIANLIRPTIYKDLLDHETVHSYSHLLGVDKNVFFIEHAQLESQDTDETSKKNLHEAQFLVALCNYFILQGYAPEEVTILTTYNGQMFLFSQERKKYSNLRKVRISVVDNYQGEESKIILLSLVRSNNENKIGYLALRNRICVALSRAREGFFMIGNMDLLSKNSPVWHDVRSELERQNAIGSELTLRCQTHDNMTKIKYGSDFEMVKFGGCQDTCSKLLECGHQCSYICHTNMFAHYSNCGCSNMN